jgi:hypothetical protein
MSELLRQRDRASMNIYVASSWRNEARQQEVVKLLKGLDHDVYDFRNPPPGEVTGFHWREIDPNWENWSAEQAVEALKHPMAQENYGVDKRHLDWAEACVLVLPCGKSAHLEAGYCKGKGKPLVTFLSDGDPELMHLLSDNIVTDLDQLTEIFKPEIDFHCTECGHQVVYVQRYYRYHDIVGVSDNQPKVALPHESIPDEKYDPYLFCGSCCSYFDLQMNNTTGQHTNQGHGT